MSEVTPRMRQVKDPSEWHSLAIRTFGDTRNLNRLTWDEIEFISARNGVLIPGWVRSSGSGRGKNKVFNSVPNLGVADQSNPQPSVQYYAKISPRDPVTNRFTSVKDDVEAQRLTKLMDAALNSPAHEVMKQEMEDPDTLFASMADLTRLVVKGVSPSLFIYGGPGTGKTTVVNKTLQSEGLIKDADYYVIKGKITPVSLYQTLFIHRNSSTLLVFDDADTAFGSEDSANILKAALDSHDERILSWSSNRTVNVDRWKSLDRKRYENEIDDRLMALGEEDEEETNNKRQAPIKLPNKFKFDGKIIFISNLPKERVDSAILSRSYKIDMTLTPDQIFKRMETLLPNMVPEVDDLELKQRVLSVIKANFKVGKLEAPDLRTLESAIKIANSGLPNWISLLKYT